MAMPMHVSMPMQMQVRSAYDAAWHDRGGTKGVSAACDHSRYDLQRIGVGAHTTVAHRSSGGSGKPENAGKRQRIRH